jgi:phosphoribosyl 1,2-cyclic phosphodiesterase
MNVRFWGTRGSLATPGRATARYGGNTSSVEVRADDGQVLVLDAGTGIRPLGAALGSVARVDVLLSHLHMDHIQGLGFFAPLFDPAVAVHVWGPASSDADLRHRLARYLSPPLFPVHLRDVDNLAVHALPADPFSVGTFRIAAERTCHPGLTVGFRIVADGRTLAYLSDHEPALGVPVFPGPAEWTSGCALAAGADVLVHDAQYTLEEYPTHVGWGHSAVDHAIGFAGLVRARRLVTFHHDPAHDDHAIDRLTADAIARLRPAFPVIAAAEETRVDVG